MHGDIYVTSVDYKTTKRVTDTPEQERNISFSPDGRSILYASEREGIWQIYQTSLVKKEEKRFSYATDLKEERLTQTDRCSLLPKYSPDGKTVAFLEDRGIFDVVIQVFQILGVRLQRAGSRQSEEKCFGVR
jgi:Tol biopolymer transport system component